MAKVRRKSGQGRTVVLSTTITFNQDGIAEVDDEDILKVFKSVGEKTGEYEIVEDTLPKENESSKKKRGRPRKSTKDKE